MPFYYSLFLISLSFAFFSPSLCTFSVTYSCSFFPLLCSSSLLSLQYRLLLHFSLSSLLPHILYFPITTPDLHSSLQFFISFPFSPFLLTPLLYHVLPISCPLTFPISLLSLNHFPTLPTLFLVTIFSIISQFS